MVYAINISCYYFAFPEYTSHHGLHPGLNASFPRVTLNVILKSAIIHICEKHRDNSVHSLLFQISINTLSLTLNIDQTSESTNFMTEANRRQHWDAHCQGQSQATMLDALPKRSCCPFPPGKRTGSKLCSHSSAMWPSHCRMLPSSTPHCLLPTIPKRHC